MNRESEQRLARAALEASRNAHARYSGFPVGAAVMTQGGDFIGCNVENASFGLTICAERVALFHAIANGQRDFEAIAVASPGGLSPCGACRQVLAEFCEDLPILLVDLETRQIARRTSLSELLPDRFGLPDGGDVERG